MNDVARSINRAFEEGLLPSSVKSTTTYKLGRMIVKINSYEGRTRSNPVEMNLRSLYTILFKEL